MVNLTLASSLLVTFIFVWFIGCINSAVVREVELIKGWSLTNQNQSISITPLSIPSGVYSAIYSDDPDIVLKSFNDVNLRWIAHDNWTYSFNFEAPQNYEQIKFINLTFHGIDTFATIKLNGIILGETNNMFIRYSYNIKEFLNLNQTKTNYLEVILRSPIYEALKLANQNDFTPPNCTHPNYHGECHMNFLRKMQASFGWDWGLAAPSMGIWKPVTLEIHDLAIIRNIDVIISKEQDDWDLFIRVFLETGIKENFYGQLIFYALDLLEPIKHNYDKKTISFTNPIIEFHQKIPQNKTKLWWPNGYGEQKLYHLHFTWKGHLSTGFDEKQLTISQKSIRIGFRTIELIEDELDDGYSFYFRVNGIPIFMKGSNWIPSHILPEFHANKDRIKHLLESTKDANMNMLRVWGGGVYESDYFYDMADYYGILIWQDMMFACAMYPTFPEFLDSVREETLQNVKRIAYHPSIAIWATNNENEVALAQNWYGTASEKARFDSNYRQLYVGTILHEMRIVADKSRPDILISSPTNGRKTREDGFLSKRPQDPNYGDIHHYDYFTNGWNPNVYPKPRFSSEYGFQSLPSLRSWSRSMTSNDNLTNLIKHRQHFPNGNDPIDRILEMNLPDLPENHPNYWEYYIYFSQISQAMITKTETEVYRSLRNSKHNTMGALYWQLNDVWIAPSWSSIDYDGNFKILHYWAKEFMAPITVIAHLNELNEINVYVVRDTINTNDSIHLTLTMHTFWWSELFPKNTQTLEITIEPNTVKSVKQIPLKDILKNGSTKTNCFLQFQIEEHNKIYSTTYLFPEKLKNAVGVSDPLIEFDLTESCDEKYLNRASLQIKIRKPALFVYIELKRIDISSYKLSNNGFIQLVPIQTVHLEFKDPSCKKITKDDIKIITLNEFMK